MCVYIYIYIYTHTYTSLEPITAIGTVRARRRAESVRARRGTCTRADSDPEMQRRRGTGICRPRHGYSDISKCRRPSWFTLAL